MISPTNDIRLNAYQYPETSFQTACWRGKHHEGKIVAGWQDHRTGGTTDKPSIRTHERHSSDKQAFHFVSVLEDSEFLASSPTSAILCLQPRAILPPFRAEIDPFHEDWPHWLSTTAD
jgi:hypothetical protein